MGHLGSWEEQVTWSHCLQSSESVSGSLLQVFVPKINSLLVIDKQHLLLGWERENQLSTHDPDALFLSWL